MRDGPARRQSAAFPLHVKQHAFPRRLEMLGWLKTGTDKVVLHAQRLQRLVAQRYAYDGQLLLLRHHHLELVHELLGCTVHQTVGADQAAAQIGDGIAGGDDGFEEGDAGQEPALLLGHPGLALVAGAQFAGHPFEIIHFLGGVIVTQRHAQQVDPERRVRAIGQTDKNGHEGIADLTGRNLKRARSVDRRVRAIGFPANGLPSAEDEHADSAVRAPSYASFNGPPSHSDGLPKVSMRWPTACASARCRQLCGVFLESCERFIWKPNPPPTSRNGMLSSVCELPLPSSLVQMMRVWSSIEPEPPGSGVLARRSHR